MSLAADARLRERTPLLDDTGLRLLERLLEHPDAPRFNHATGDRLVAADLAYLDRYREALETRRGPREPGPPPPAILARLASLRERVPAFRARLPGGLDLGRDWASVPTTSRADVAVAPWDFVPDDEPVERLIIYRTAGTTGHPIAIPHHPIAVGCYPPLIERALERHGVRVAFEPGAVGCFLVGAQIRTYTYATVLSAWRGAGFAKLNLRPTEWPREGSQGRYLAELAPRLLTGDPISFAELLRLEAPARPAALLTTSVTLAPALRRRLEAAFAAPVIDWYSLVETGPVGYGCPRGLGFHVLPHDVHVEALGPGGAPLEGGERGEIAVSGGRNPFFPLLRYRTGDYGRLDREACPCGDPMPRIRDLEGRAPLLFRSSDGTPVSTVDLSRILREFPLLLHELVQRSDGSCELTARPLPGLAPDPREMERALRVALGGLALSIRFDPYLGDRQEGKALPFASELADAEALLEE